MVSVYECSSYRMFLSLRIASMPNKGYGQMSKLADFLGVHSTLVSQILKEHKSLSTDQAALVTNFFGLNEAESEYFILLVNLDRAGNTAAKAIYKRQLKKAKELAQNISQRVTTKGTLSEEQRAVFYSDWAYSAVRQTLSLPGIKNVDTVAEYLGLPRNKVRTLLDFLLKTGLCVNINGQITTGPASTHVEASSPWVRVHHSNWRQRAIQSLDKNNSENLYYTSPLTLSKADAQIIYEKIIQFILHMNSIVDPSPSEALFCLNIDWFREGSS